MSNTDLLVKKNINDERFLTECVQSEFLKNAIDVPNHIALVVGQNEWTYKELFSTASRWANCIKENCDNKRVGIFGYKSETSYIGVLASLLAGATFVPLNPNFPVSRTQTMIQEANLDAIIVGDECLDFFNIIMSDENIFIPLVLFPTCATEKKYNNSLSTYTKTQLERYPQLGRNEMEIQTKESIAYILFTSGSTGNPKGVPITHANVVHFLKINQEKYNITAEDRLTQTFDQTFDLSIFDLFMAWSNGATLCSMSPMQLISPHRFIEEKGITIWFSVPSIITLLRKQRILKEGTLSKLRLSLFCGEPLHKDAVESWRIAAPNSVIENLYGPTELTIACFSYLWEGNHSEKECVNNIVPIGKPYKGLEYKVVNDQLLPVKDGEIGELCVTGAQTFPGYLNNSQLSKEKLIHLSSKEEEEKIYYRTGDQVKVLPSGNLSYVGRVDHQAKVNGYRVECGEVEGVLMVEKNVLSAAVLPWPFENGVSKGLVAFVVGDDIVANDIIVRMREKLPSYMIPKKIYGLNKMPLNINGKIDRKQLYELLENKVVK